MSDRVQSTPTKSYWAAQAVMLIVCAIGLVGTIVALVVGSVPPITGEANLACWLFCAAAGVRRTASTYITRKCDREFTYGLIPVPNAPLFGVFLAIGVSVAVLNVTLAAGGGLPRVHGDLSYFTLGPLVASYQLLIWVTLLVGTGAAERLTYSLSGAGMIYLAGVLNRGPSDLPYVLALLVPAMALLVISAVAPDFDVDEWAKKALAGLLRPRARQLP